MLVSLEKFDQSDFFDKMERVSIGLEARALSLFYITLSIIQSAITISGFIIIFIYIHWLLAVSLIRLVFPSIFVNLKISKLRFVQIQYQTPTERKQYYLLSLLKGRLAVKVHLLNVCLGFIPLRKKFFVLF